MKTEYNSKLIYVIAVVAATGGLFKGGETMRVKVQSV